MHDLLQFIRVWSVFVGCGFIFVAVFAWIVFFRDPRMRERAPSFTSMVFSPLLERFGVGRPRTRSISTRTPAGASVSGPATSQARRFRTIREAKEYLAGKIAEEAEREGAPLTDVEQKMLYFTESGWTLPDMMTVSAEFDRDSDQDEYERKIAGFVGRIVARNDGGNEQEREDWDSAVERLGGEDHYILVLSDAAPLQSGPGSPILDRLRLFMPTTSKSGPRPPGDFGRLILMAFALPVVIAILGFVLDRIFGPDWYDHLRHFLR